MPTRLDEQKERREILQQDLASHRVQQSLLRTPNQRQPDNAKAYSQLPVDQPDGRFAVATKQAALSGSKPNVDYPAGPNWAAQAVGVEPPLDMDVNWLAPVGEPWEIEEAQRIQDMRALDAAADHPVVSAAVAPASPVAPEPERSPLAAPARPLRRRPLLPPAQCA